MKHTRPTPIAHHAWATYADLAQCWKVGPETVRRWVSAFARQYPDRAFLSFRLHRGYRRERLVRSDTAVWIEPVRIPLVPMASSPTARASVRRSRTASPGIACGRGPRAGTPQKLWRPEQRAKLPEALRPHARARESGTLQDSGPRKGSRQHTPRPLTAVPVASSASASSQDDARPLRRASTAARRL